MILNFNFHFFHPCALLSLHLSIVVLIHASTAEVVVSHILLDGWLAPSTKGREVTEAWIVIPVSIPKRIGFEGGGRASDGVPIVGTGINTHRIAFLAAFSQHGRDEVHIVRGSRGPIVESFNIQPQHAHSGSQRIFAVLSLQRIASLVLLQDANIMAGQIADGGINLTSGVATGVAGEDVAIHVSHACLPSIIDVGGSIGIWISSRAIDANNGEIIAIALKARKAGLIGSLAHIHTSDCVDEQVGEEAGCQQNLQEDTEHL